MDNNEVNLIWNYLINGRHVVDDRIYEVVLLESHLHILFSYVEYLLKLMLE